MGCYPFFPWDQAVRSKTRFWCIISADAFTVNLHVYALYIYNDGHLHMQLNLKHIQPTAHAAQHATASKDKTCNDEMCYERLNSCKSLQRFDCTHCLNIFASPAKHWQTPVLILLSSFSSYLSLYLFSLYTVAPKRFLDI